MTAGKNEQLHNSYWILLRLESQRTNQCIWSHLFLLFRSFCSLVSWHGTDKRLHSGITQHPSPHSESESTMIGVAKSSEFSKFGEFTSSNLLTFTQLLSTHLDLYVYRLKISTLVQFLMFYYPWYPCTMPNVRRRRRWNNKAMVFLGFEQPNWCEFGSRDHWCSF
jgi:hypothetical protein